MGHLLNATDTTGLSRTHRRYWSWYRRRYDAIWDSSATARWTAAAASHLIGPLVLDVGTGTGLMGRAARRHGHTVIGLDAVPEMLTPALGPDRATRALLADAQQLPLASRSLDSVTLANVLHVLPDPAAALREARRVVRPGGRIVVSWPHDDIHPRTIRRADQAARWPATAAWRAHLLRILVGIPGSTLRVRRHRRAALAAALEAALETGDHLTWQQHDVVEVGVVHAAPHP